MNSPNNLFEKVVYYILSFFGALCFIFTLYFMEYIAERVMTALFNPLVEVLFEELLKYPLLALALLFFIISPIILFTLTIGYVVGSWWYGYTLYRHNLKGAGQYTDFSQKNLKKYLQNPNNILREISNDWATVLLFPIILPIMLVFYLVGIVTHKTYQTFFGIKYSTINLAIFVTFQVLFVIPKTPSMQGTFMLWDIYTQYLVLFLIILLSAEHVVANKKSVGEEIQKTSMIYSVLKIILGTIIAMLALEMILLQFIIIPYTVLIIVLSFFIARIISTILRKTENHNK